MVTYLMLHAQTTRDCRMFPTWSASVFSVAYIMYLVLEIEHYFSVDTSAICGEVTRKNIVVLFVQLVFVLVQTFFLFKIQEVRQSFYVVMWRTIVTQL